MRTGTGRRAGRRLARWQGALPLASSTVVAAALVAGCSGGADVPERAAEDAPARTTSTTAAPPPSLERVSATASVLPGGADSRFTGVAVGARGIVAVGELAGEAAVWTTFDGVAYDPVPLAPGEFPEGSVLRDVVVTDDGFVAVGRAAGSAAAWASSDGRVWTRSDLTGGTDVDVVIVGELGITAFGRDGPSLATWTSFEGTSWQRVPGGPSVFDRPGPARVVGARDDGEGYLAVVDRQGVAETWSSPDGRVWEPSPSSGADLLPGAGPPRPAAVLGAGSTTVVLGAVADPDGVDAAVWTSLAGAPWERVGGSEAVFGGDGAQAVLGAAQLGADLVAVGTDTDEAGDVDAVVWSTGAGGAWRRSPGSADDGLSGPGDQHAVDLAPTRRGALVVGWEARPEGTRAVAWMLADGDAPAGEPPAGPVLAWRRVAPTESLGGPGEQRLDAVVASGSELVGVGSSSRADAPAGDLDGAVWRSVDGVEWERVPDTGGALGGPGDERLLAVVEPAGSGRSLVAVGGDGSSAAVWVRFPGDAGWARVPGDEAIFGGPGEQVARAVATRPDGSLVAVGADGGSGDGDGAVWRSAAGRSWERVVPGGDLGGPGVQELSDVAVVGPLLVAVGRTGDEAAAWSSLDGTTWQRTTLGPGRAHALAQVEGGVVAVGSSPGDGLDAAAWRSVDGITWSPVGVDDGELAAADQEVLDVAVTTPAEGEPVVAGVGWTNLGPGDDGAAWGSADGSGWARAPHDEDAYGGDRAQRMLALATLGDVAVAVGWSGSEPADRDAAVWVTAPAGGAGGVL